MVLILIGDYNRQQLKEKVYDCLIFFKYPTQTTTIANYLYETTGIDYSIQQITGVLTKLMNEGRVKKITKRTPYCKKLKAFWVIK